MLLIYHQNQEQHWNVLQYKLYQCMVALFKDSMDEIPTYFL